MFSNFHNCFCAFNIISWRFIITSESSRASFGSYLYCHSHKSGGKDIRILRMQVPITRHNGWLMGHYPAGQCSVGQCVLILRCCRIIFRGRASLSHLSGPSLSPAPSCKSPHCVRALLSGAGFTGGGSVTSDDGTRISTDGGWPPAGLVLPLLGPRGLAVSALRAGVRVCPPSRPPPSSTPGHLPPLRRGGVGRGRQGRSRLTIPY